MSEEGCPRNCTGLRDSFSDDDRSQDLPHYHTLRKGTTDPPIIARWSIRKNMQSPQSMVEVQEDCPIIFGIFSNVTITGLNCNYRCN